MEDRLLCTVHKKARNVVFNVPEGFSAADKAEVLELLGAALGVFTGETHSAIDPERFVLLKFD